MLLPILTRELQYKSSLYGSCQLRDCAGVTSLRNLQFVYVTSGVQSTMVDIETHFS